jgi:putative transposase
MYYHLVLVVKYRRQVFDSKISNFAKEIFVEIGSKYNISIVEWNHHKDHIYILFKGHPNSELSKFINDYKSASSRLIKRDFPQIRKNYGKKCFGQEVSVSNNRRCFNRYH